MRLNDKSTDFWRTIALRASSGRVNAEVCDNVHHFRVTVRHNGQAVTAVTGEAIRIPWMTCSAAAGQLRALVGTPVGGASPQIDPSQQCTHLLDLARLAITHIGRGGTRDLRVEIRFDATRNAAVASLAVDGRAWVEWLTRDGIVVSDGPFQGHDTKGRSSWSQEVMADPALREAGLMLRRALLVFRGRNTSAPMQRAADVEGMEGVCYSFLREHAAAAVRPPGFHELP